MESETGGKEAGQAILFVDVPSDVATDGMASFDVLASGNSILWLPATVYIQPGTVTPYAFDTVETGTLSTNALASMERAEHYTVTFSGSEVPAALQVDFSHFPDRENGGSGQAYVVHPRGDIISASWTDTGDTLRVILLPSWHKTPEDINANPYDSLTIDQYNFYVAGGITDLQPTSVNAYKVTGAPVDAPVSVSIQ